VHGHNDDYGEDDFNDNYGDDDDNDDNNNTIPHSITLFKNKINDLI
jgi:hypothetical protein